jgi:hypothetical protein
MTWMELSEINECQREFILIDDARRYATSGDFAKNAQFGSGRSHRPNENKMSDGWRDGAWLRFHPS